MDRRNFIISGITLVGLSSGFGVYLFKQNNRVHSKEELIKFIKEYAANLRGISLDIKNQDSILSENDILVKIFSRYESLIEDEKIDLSEYTKILIENDFKNNETKVIDGWIISDLEYQFIQLHLALSKNPSFKPIEDKKNFANAELKNFMKVHEWGPKNTCVNQSFNEQSDGHSSNWIQIEPYPGLLELYIGGRAIKITKGVDVITTKIEGELFESLTKEESSHEVVLYDKSKNIKQIIGSFDVLSKSNYSDSSVVNNIDDNSIEDWGPKEIDLKNIKDTESVIFWFKSRCAPPDLIFSALNNILNTTYTTNLLTAVFPLSLINNDLEHFEVNAFSKKQNKNIKIGKVSIIR